MVFTKRKTTKMKKFLQVSVMLAVLSVAGGLFAQTDASGNLPKGTQASVRKYPEVKSKIVSFAGTATATLAIKGRGVLVGVDLTPVDSTGNVATTLFGVAFYDKGSTNNMVIGDGGNLIYSQKKIIGDVTTPFVMASSGGPASPGNVNPRYDNPVQFESGIVIYNNTSATKGSVTVYWIQ